MVPYLIAGLVAAAGVIAAMVFRGQASAARAKAAAALDARLQADIRLQKVTAAAADMSARSKAALAAVVSELEALDRMQSRDPAEVRRRLAALLASPPT